MVELHKVLQEIAWVLDKDKLFDAYKWILKVETMQQLVRKNPTVLSPFGRSYSQEIDQLLKIDPCWTEKSQK